MIIKVKRLVFCENYEYGDVHVMIKAIGKRVFEACIH